MTAPISAAVSSKPITSRGKMNCVIKRWPIWPTVTSAGAGKESQISYWSWGERQIPVEQFFGSTR